MAWIKMLKRAAKTVPEGGRLTIDQYEVAYIVHRRPKRRRTLSLYVESASQLRLLVPMRTTNETIQRMFDDRKHWIAQRLAELRQGASFSSPPEFRHGDALPYLGEAHILHITHNPLLPQGCQAAEGRLNVNLHHAPVNVAETREDVRLEILLWYKKKAKDVLKTRTDYWSEKLDLKYRSLKISSPMRLWGSCSPKNDIRYNWRIIIAAPEIIDYLVVHELCHIAHKDHSRRFWALLASVIPDWRLRRKQLRCLDPAFDL
jgi:predicted metal-dependent hydrolase